MGTLAVRAGVVLCAIGLCGSAFCQEQPEKITLCQLKNAPPDYNHKLVEVTAFVLHDFEDFTLFDPTCPSWPDVWLEYGGTSKSGTMYCCGVTDERQRTEELVVEKIPIKLTINDEFRKFDKLLQAPFRSKRHGSIVHATLVGRFFSGERQRFLKGNPWGGFGHMGCCTLLAIQEIKSVDSQDRDDLDYGASSDQPDVDKTGCGYRELTPLEPAAELIEAQRRAEYGQEGWAFDHPERVATDALGRLATMNEPIVGLKARRKAQGRIVYEWKPTRKRLAYMIVVSRPYWLSFYARDAKRVAWVVAAAYESCDKRN
ncbi:MAG: hypothetical protein WA609_18120 [Terriglobales bacterium]